jgi:hypothetical protein
MKQLSLLCILSLVLCAGAWGDIIPHWVSVTGGPAVYTWTYDVDLTLNQSLIASKTPYFTLYDFLGYIDNSCAGPDADWTCTDQTVGVTPIGISPYYPDKPNVPNITWFYHGASKVGPQDLGSFTAQSTIGGVGLIAYTAQAWQNTTPQFLASNRGVVAGPVPEPYSMLTVGAGLIALAFIRRRVFR